METVICACGCGRVRPKYDTQNRKRRFIFGHAIKISREKLIEGRKKKGVWNKGLTIKNDIRMKKLIEKSAKSRIGHAVSQETREKIGLKHKGEKHPNFNNWSSREPYGKEFSPKLKEQIRKSYDYRCQECFRHQNELFKNTIAGIRPYKLYIHHIDYDKTNNSKDNLIPLCGNCHSKTNWRNKDWTSHFKDKIEHRKDF